MIRYCSVCRCNRWHTQEGDCVVCIGLFSDVISRAAQSAGDTK
jgi:hypothetical protein